METDNNWYSSMVSMRTGEKPGRRKIRESRVSRGREKVTVSNTVDEKTRFYLGLEMGKSLPS